MFHSHTTETVSFPNSQRILLNNGIPVSALTVVVREHRRQNKANPRRAACRSRRHCVDATPNHGLRLNEDSKDQRKTAGGSTDVGSAISGIAGPVSKRRNGWGRMPAGDGIDWQVMALLADCHATPWRQRFRNCLDGRSADEDRSQK
jgi:hypothetical protein